MKPVIGLFLVFIGLGIGYLVLTGRLPSSTATTSPTSGGSSTSSSGSGLPASKGSIVG